MPFHVFGYWVLKTHKGSVLIPVPAPPFLVWAALPTVRLQFWKLDLTTWLSQVLCIFSMQSHSLLFNRVGMCGKKTLCSSCLEWFPGLDLIVVNQVLKALFLLHTFSLELPSKMECHSSWGLGPSQLEMAFDALCYHLQSSCHHMDNPAIHPLKGTCMNLSPAARADLRKEATPSRIKESGDTNRVMGGGRNAWIQQQIGTQAAFYTRCFAFRMDVGGVCCLSSCLPSVENHVFRKRSIVLVEKCFC